MSRENSNSTLLTLSDKNELKATDVSRLCVKSLEAGIEVDIVKKLIQALNLQPDKSAISLENWPWPVKIYTLGDFSVEIDSQRLQFEGKVQKKPLELLKALLALGGRNISKETLTETLWPDTEGDDAHQTLATTLHRLRNLIGHDAIILQQGQLSLSLKHCWSDLWSFEYFMSAAANELAHDQLEAAWQSTEKALRLYHGAFLENEITSSWVLSMRERLRRKLLHHINTICSRLCQNNRYEQAINGYLKGLDIDDLQEKFYRGLIICYQHLGQEAEAQSVYRQCHSLLTTILGQEPSAETQSLIKQRAI